MRRILRNKIIMLIGLLKFSLNHYNIVTFQILEVWVEDKFIQKGCDTRAKKDNLFFFLIQ